MKVDPSAYGPRGRWTTFDLPKGFDEKEREFMRLSPQELQRLWEEAGSKDISVFGLRWQPRGISDGWLYLSNQDAMVPHQMVFSMAADPTNFSHYPNIKERMEQTAVLLALHFGMQEYKFVPVVGE